MVARNCDAPDDIIDIGPVSLFSGIEDAREHALWHALALFERLDRRGGLGHDTHEKIKNEIEIIKEALDG